MPEYNSDNYDAAITIDSLEKDVLLLQSMVGTDQISKPYTYMVDLVRNPGETVDISTLAGKKASIELRPRFDKGTDRYFHGYISEIRYGGATGSTLEMFHMVVVPWFWFLKKSAKCRIFRTLRADQVLSTIFKAVKFETGEHFKIDIEDTSALPVLEHCVQYQETDFAFASRLMEEFGISYYFTQEKEKHQMVLINSSGKRPKAGKGFDKMIYSEARVSAEDNAITRWENQYQVVTDKFTQTDFNFASKEKFPEIVDIPKQESKGEDQGDIKYGSLERYIHEGVFIDDGVLDPHTDGNIKEFKDLAKVRLGALQTEKELIYMETDCRGLQVYSQFKFESENEKSHKNHKGKEFYLLAIHHQIELGKYGAGANESGKKYTCTASAIPKDVEYYPPRVTPKARILGPQTAVVVGDDKDEKKLIYTDQHGRIKVKFHWDREDDRDEIDEKSDKKAEVKDKPQNQSCWVRVAQSWAGKNWGSFFLPRVGHEVVVEFLDGDPDRPIVTGSVYNAKNLVPYSLPDNKTMSVIKSESVDKDAKKIKEADKITNNIIRFQDKEEEEQLFIQAGRSFDQQVLGDYREYVGCNLQLTVDGNKDNEKKSNDKAIGNRDVIIKEGNDQLDIQKGNLIQKVGGSYLLDLTNHKSLKIGGALNIQVKGAVIIESGSAIHIKSAKSITTEAKESISFKAGGDIMLEGKGAINLKSGDKILGEGKSGVGITGGKSAIDVSSDVGIKGGSKVIIKGKSVDMNGAPPTAPAAPAAAESAQSPTIQAAKDLDKATVQEALVEEETNEKEPKKEIEFGELK